MKPGAGAAPVRKERPIIFSGPMVRAILEGQKTMTRRVCKAERETLYLQPSGRMMARPLIAHNSFDFSRPVKCWRVGPGDTAYSFAWKEDERPDNAVVAMCSPYGHPGNRLWVRETWSYNKVKSTDVIYRADVGDAVSYYLKTGEKGTEEVVNRWRPSIHMPRRASRIILEVTGVRVERLQEISETDAKAEGCAEHQTIALVGGDPCYTATFRDLWESLHGIDNAKSWESNPWVWVVEFKRVTP